MTVVLERRLHEIFKRRMADVEARALGGGRQLAVKNPRSKSAKPPLQKFFFCTFRLQHKDGEEEDPLSGTI